MRRAAPNELRSTAAPAITARVSEAELQRWFPVPFDEIAEPLAVPEPTRSALVQLEYGAYIVVSYGKDSGQLFVDIPETTPNVSDLIAAFFREVPLPMSRVIWHRDDITLPDRRIKRSAQRVSLPKKTK